MKRIILAVALLPLVSFGDIVPTKVSVFRWWSFDQTLVANNTTSPLYNVSCEDDVYSAFSSSVFGFKVNPIKRNYNYGVIVPSYNKLFSSATSQSGLTITNSVLCKTNGVACGASPLVFPSCAALFTSCAVLFHNGYRGTGFVDIFENGSEYCINVDYPTLVADIVSSTNTVYRQILFSYLGQINTSLSSIGSNVGTINTDYQTVNNLYLNPSAQSVKDSAASQYTVDGSSSIAANTDRLFGMSRTGRESETAKALAELAREQLKAVVTATLDPSSDFFGQDVTDILNDSDKFPAAVAQGGGGGALGGIARDLKRLSTNDWVSAVTNQLANNRASITNELARNRANITNQLAHMFDDTPNSAGRAIRDTANNTFSAANAAGSIDERLQRGITVAVVNEGNTSVGVHLDGPVNIDSTQWQTLSTPLGSVSSLLDSLYGDFSTFYGFGNSNYDWSHFFELVQSFKNQNHIDLAAISSQSVTGDVSRIYDYLSGYQSNILYEIATSITNSWDDYYFTRFRRANEFIDESETAFSISVASDEVFGNGFDEQEFANLNWFSRVELLLYQLQKANDTTNVLESADLEGEFDDSVQRFNLAGTNFVAASVRVVNLFGFISRFADSVKLAFQSSASPVTDGVLLMEGGSWLVNEPLILRVPIAVQNALRLVFQCIWYLSAFVIGWRIVVVTWDKVVTLVRWLWSVFDV